MVFIEKKSAEICRKCGKEYAEGRVWINGPSEGVRLTCGRCGGQLDTFEQIEEHERLIKAAQEAGLL